MLDQKTRQILLAARERAAVRGVTASLALHRERSHLMRIGNNSVSLNTTEHLTRLDVLVTDGRREGSHTRLGEITSQAAVDEAVEISARKAAVAMPKDYEPIPPAVEEPVDEASQYDPVLAALDPAVKAGVYAEVMAGAGAQYNFSGSWSSGVTERYLVTTAGLGECYHLGTDQCFSIVLKHPERKWELAHEQTGWRAGEVTAGAALGHFRECLPVFERNAGVRIAPGEYTVLFGAQALADLLGMAIWTGCTGRIHEEKRGWTAKQALGDRVLGENISVWDDPLDPLTFQQGFDLGGRRRRKFNLVECGRLAGLMYDRSTAAKYGKRPTGHEGASGLVLACGTGPADPLAAARAQGGRMLYIPALHYGNLPNMSKGIVTGSSRFSARLVEDGQVSAPLFSSRLTDTFSNIFGNIRVLSSRPVSVNASNTYSRRAPEALSVPSYCIAEGVKITDCAESF